MRFIRYSIEGEPPQPGWLLGDSPDAVIGPIEGSLYQDFRRLEANIPLESAHLYAPVQPSKIICIGRNYAAHAKEHQAEVPEVPLLFLKPPSSIIGPNESISLPPQSRQIEHEAELVVVIGKRGRWIAPQDALEYILGYTIGNDVTARDLQRRDGQWTRGKGFDTFCPVGPWIETDFDPADSVITCHVNNEMRQMASTRDMVFGVGQLIGFASSVMTLEAGDLLFTGTPSGVGPLSPGDEVVVTVEGLGSLTNQVRAEAVQ